MVEKMVERIIPKWFPKDAYPLSFVPFALFQLKSARKTINRMVAAKYE